jgi:hypothetical protein
METLEQILMQSADAVSGLLNVFFAFVTDPASIPATGGLLSPTFVGRIIRSVIRRLPIRPHAGERGDNVFILKS